jgi:hypothetical protein
MQGAQMCGAVPTARSCAFSQVYGAGGLYPKREQPPSTIKEAVSPFGVR